jgi:hypothetical protein
MEGCAMRTILTCIFMTVGAAAAHGQNRPPIIDMHLHAHRLVDYGGGMAVCANDQEILYAGLDPRQPTTPASSPQIKTCASPISAAADDEAITRETHALLDRYNIFAVTTGPLERVRAWRAAAPDRIIPAHAFGDPGSPGVEEFRSLLRNRELAVLAEVSPQYLGLSLDDPTLSPTSLSPRSSTFRSACILGRAPTVAPTARFRGTVRVSPAPFSSKKCWCATRSFAST